MTRIGWAALVAAILASAYSIAEAIAAPITGHPLIDQESGPNPALTIVGALLISTFTLGVAVLWEQAERIDAGSSFRRWVRRLLQAALAALALISGIGMWPNESPRTGWSAQWMAPAASRSSACSCWARRSASV